MKQQINSTELHIQYFMETGDFFQWESSVYYSGKFTDERGYKYDYGKWLEEKYLDLLNKCKDQSQKIKELEEINEHLEEEVDFYVEQQAKEDL